MSHLPECPAPCCEWRPQPCDCQCLCDLLRAVEERVEESMDRVWTNALRIKQAEAYANGVQAARDAVAALNCPTVFASPLMFDLAKAVAVAAIDALRDDSLTPRNVTGSDLAIEQRNGNRDDSASANADAHVNVSERRLGDIPTPHDAAESPLYDGAWHRDLYGDADGLRGME